VIPAYVRDLLRAPATLAAAREAFVAAPLADVVVVVGAGVEVPPSIGPTRPAGRARVAAVSLDVAVDVVRSRSTRAADELAAPPAVADAVRLLYLGPRREVAIGSLPGHVAGRRAGTDGARGDA
jgi:hypothetical protein